MDPSSSDASFTASLYKWEPRPHVVAGIVHNGVVLPQRQPQPTQMVAAAGYSLVRPREMGELEEMFEAYGVRYYTAAKIAELGFTVSTLVDMREEELDDMMNSLTHIFRWDLMVGERYGIKAAVRAERRRLDEGELQCRNLLLGPNAAAANAALDALSHEGLSEEPEQQAEKEAAGSGGGGAKGIREVAGGATGVSRLKQVRKKGQRNMSAREDEENEYDIEEGICERQREHPFIVTEPGEVARGKKNGLDYLFHLYEQCREFLMQVQTFAKERGEKCPSKVTNQVFRHAKRAGASYINKPKMRHYVHCYAFHCLDEEASNALRRSFKERGENVGAWRQACYKPLVLLAARQGWDIDAIFNSHPRLAIWYVPTKLRQLCHAERSSASASSSVDGTGHLCFSTLDTKFH